MSYKASVLVDTPAGFWRLSDAAAAAVASDDSGNARPGSYTGSPTLGASSPLTRDVATAMTLDGVDDLMDVPDNAAFDGVADFSLEIWFKTGALSDTNVKLFYKRLGGNGYALHITTATGLLTFECETGAVNNQLNTAVTNYADGVWHHVVATRTGANARIYVDGALVAGPTALTSNSLANTAVLRLGSNDTVNRRFVGSLFGAAYYGAALSAAQVAAHYAARLLWDYATAIVSDQVEVVTVVEVQAMERLGVWTAAGGGLTNTFYCTFLSQIQTSIVPGGIYRRLDSVKQNATALTSRASSALVDANLGSYFLDTSTNRLYVSTSTGANPDGFVHMGAWFTFFLATTSVSLSGQPLYSPVITGSLPTFTSEMPDPLFGATISASGGLTILNTDGLFDRLSKQYVWRNKLVTFKLGGGALAYTDFVTIDTLRINAIAVDDEVAALQLEDLGNILNKSLPLRTWGDGTLFNAPSAQLAADGIEGISQPLVFGAVLDCPCVLGGRNGLAGADYWYAYDFNFGGYGTCQIFNVYAINRTTKARTLLVGGIDYVVSGANIQVITATYFYENYDIVCGLRQLGTLASPTFGTMALAILRICGESDANIDTAAFAAADTAAPQILARYVGSPIIAADLMRELEQSVNGQVYKGADGRWTCRLLTPDLPASIVELTDADFVTWAPVDDLVTTLNEVRVGYNHQPLGDSWTEATSSDDSVLYAVEEFDSHRLRTWLTDANDAAALAAHLRFLRAVPPIAIQSEQRGLSLMAARVGDLVSVTRARAANARTGTYDTHLLRIVEIVKSLGGGVPIVKVGLNDLDGQTDRIARYTDATAIAWSTATVQQKARYGFYADASGYLDAADPATRYAKVYY